MPLVAAGAAVVLLVGGIFAVRSCSSSEDAPAEAEKAAKPSPPREVKPLPEGVFMVKPNGGWSWFQDERVIVDGDKALVATVAGAKRDGAKPGDIQVTTFDIAKKTSAVTTLHDKLRDSDIAAPAIVRLADGRYLAAFTAGKDKTMRFRVSEKPGDASAWKPEKKLELKGDTSYANLAVEPGKDGRVFNFYRGEDGLPHAMTAAAAGEDFTAAPAFLGWTRKSPTFDEKKSTRPDEPRPYLRYASRGGVVHFIATEDHPRSYDTSIWHGYIRGTALHDSAGTVLDDDVLKGEPIELTKLTRVFEGKKDSVPWTVDIDLDAEGKPFVAFVVQKDGKDRASKKTPGGDDHRFHFARFDGKAWTDSEIAYAGRRLYKQEENFTGLVALVPKNPDVVFISTNVDPATGDKPKGEQHFELYRGASQDRGKTWKWTALTKDSGTENIRPVVPEWAGGTLVMWLRGSYKSIGSFDLDVVGMIDPQSSPTPAGSTSAGAPASASAKAPAATPSAKAPAAAPSAKP